MDARTRALIWDFVAWALLGFFVGAMPLLEDLMQADLNAYDWRKFAIALVAAAVSGVIGAIRKLMAPQMVSVGESSGTGKPIVVGVALKDIQPAPPTVSQVEVKRPTVSTLDKIGADKIEGL